jgi:hypothetical protein
LRPQLLLLVDQRGLLGLELGDLLVERLQLGLRELLALERGAGEVLAVLRERLRACVSSLTTCCSSFCCWSWRRFLDVTTSAMPFLTFWSSSICFW